MLELCFYKYTAGAIRKQRIIPYIYFIIPCLLSDYSLLKISWYFTIALSKTSKIPNKLTKPFTIYPLTMQAHLLTFSI